MPAVAPPQDVLDIDTPDGVTRPGCVQDGFEDVPEVVPDIQVVSAERGGMPVAEEEA